MTFIPLFAAIAIAASPAPAGVQAEPAAHTEHQQHQAQQPETKVQHPAEASSKSGMAEMHGKMGADCHCCCCEAMMGKHGPSKEAPANAEDHKHEQQ